jgi:hypothetical protein
MGATENINYHSIQDVKTARIREKKKFKRVRLLVRVRLQEKSISEKDIETISTGYTLS